MLKNKLTLAALILGVGSIAAFNAYSQLSSGGKFDKVVNDLMSTHFKDYKDSEYFSGIALSVYLPKADNGAIKNYHIGNVSHDPDSPAISDQSLFQIGSITKSFTAAVILQLEKEGSLTLSDTVGKWLPKYAKWSDIDVKRMLNMTTGLPNYSDAPAWSFAVSKDMARPWKEEELIAFAYPQGKFNPPLKPGYFYTNTGYVLTGLIAEKASKQSVKSLYEERLFKKAGLTNTHYPVPALTPDQLKRMAHGYNYNQYDSPPLVGKDVVSNSMTWAGAAGGIIATSEDVVKWVKALFIDNVILDDEQKSKLTQIVSLRTGEPIDHTTKDDDRGFGLGVVQGYDVDHGIGTYWFYEGETLGYRALYLYKPCNGVIISVIFNSAVNSENDKSGQLLIKTYQAIMDQYPSYRCEG